MTDLKPCRFGYEEYDGARYCFEHGGFLEAGMQSRRCDRAALADEVAQLTRNHEHQLRQIRRLQAEAFDQGVAAAVDAGDYFEQGVNPRNPYDDGERP